MNLTNIANRVKGNKQRLAKDFLYNPRRTAYHKKFSADYNCHPLHGEKYLFEKLKDELLIKANVSKLNKSRHKYLERRQSRRQDAKQGAANFIFNQLEIFFACTLPKSLRPTPTLLRSYRFKHTLEYIESNSKNRETFHSFFEKAFWQVYDTALFLFSQEKQRKQMDMFAHSILILFDIAAFYNLSTLATFKDLQQNLIKRHSPPKYKKLLLHLKKASFHYDHYVSSIFFIETTLACFQLFDLQEILEETGKAIFDNFLNNLNMKQEKVVYWVMFFGKIKSQFSTLNEQQQKNLLKLFTSRPTKPCLFLFGKTLSEKFNTLQTEITLPRLYLLKKQGENATSFINNFEQRIIETPLLLEKLPFSLSKAFLYSTSIVNNFDSSSILNDQLYSIFKKELISLEGLNIAFPLLLSQEELQFLRSDFIVLAPFKTLKKRYPFSYSSDKNLKNCWADIEENAFLSSFLSIFKKIKEKDTTLINIIKTSFEQLDVIYDFLTKEDYENALQAELAYSELHSHWDIFLGLAETYDSEICVNSLKKLSPSIYQALEKLAQDSNSKIYSLEEFNTHYDKLSHCLIKAYLEMQFILQKRKLISPFIDIVMFSFHQKATAGGRE